MIIEFYIENNNLKKREEEVTINSESTDVTFKFELNEEWENYTPYCIVKTKTNIFRLKLHKNEEIYECKLPKSKIIPFFIKLSIYGINNENVITTNELIIPIEDSGYPLKRCSFHHDRFHHHGKHHIHHSFPYHFYHSRNDMNHCNYHKHKRSFKHPSQWDKFDKLFIYHKMNNDNAFYGFPHDSNWKCGRIDEFDMMIESISDSANNILIDEDKCYVYCDDELIQVIQIPEYITKDKLSFLIDDLLEDVNMFDDGDIIISKNFFKRH